MQIPRDLLILTSFTKSTCSYSILFDEVEINWIPQTHISKNGGKHLLEESSNNYSYVQGFVCERRWS